MRKRSWNREVRVDPLTLAIVAVASGSLLPAHWETLTVSCKRDGTDSVARALAERGGASEHWWRCNLLLSRDLPLDRALALVGELLNLDARGDGLAFDADRHALEVSTVVRYLQAHLTRLRTGAITQSDYQAAVIVVRAARVAQQRAQTELGSCWRQC
jgi:hypothetical protein